MARNIIGPYVSTSDVRQGFIAGFVAARTDILLADPESAEFGPELGMAERISEAITEAEGAFKALLAYASVAAEQAAT